MLTALVDWLASHPRLLLWALTMGLLGYPVGLWGLATRRAAARARDAFLEADGAARRQTVRLLEERRAVAQVGEALRIALRART